MHEYWGHADDGALVHITLTGEPARQLPTPDASTAPMPNTPGSWWPPIGLTLVAGPPPARNPSLFLTADLSQPGALDRLESDLGLFTAERLAGLVAVHAAVLVHRDVMILVPGESMVGKTTLCAAALASTPRQSDHPAPHTPHGHTPHIEVWSDEYALVNPADGTVRGWPRRLRVRTPDGGADRVDISPRADTSAALVPSLVALVRYDSDLPGDTALRSSPCSDGDVAFALLANTVCAQSRPEFAFAGALAVASRCAGITGTRGDATAALAKLFSLATTGN